MPNAPSWFHNASSQQPGSSDQPKSMASRTYSQRLRDTNIPNNSYSLTWKSVYERRLPGGSYITAHVSRLQRGYFDTPSIHEDCIDNVRFAAINFVFHPVDTRHRFIAATIRLALHPQHQRKPSSVIPLPPQIPRHSVTSQDERQLPKQKPKFLQHAPHLLYGALSPETMDWNFNLAGSLGVSQMGANASLTPSGGVKSSYKVFKMMKIQGSVRTSSSWFGQEYEVEDGELIWTLEENYLQKSGLPREFTFVMLFSKGDPSLDTKLEVDIDPTVGSWYGVYPKFWLSRIWYQPFVKEPLDLDEEIGQKFLPCSKAEGFNFANLIGSLDDFVSMPGTTFSSGDPTPDLGPQAAANTSNANQPPQPGVTQRQITASPMPQDRGKNNDVNIRVFLEGWKPPAGTPRSATPTLYPPVTGALQQLLQQGGANGATISRTRRPRPTSDIYYPSSTSETAAHHTATDQKGVKLSAAATQSPGRDASLLDLQNANMTSRPNHHRQMSNITDLSDDVWLQQTADPATAPHQSHSLRRSQSHDDLMDDLGLIPTNAGKKIGNKDVEGDDESGISTAMEALTGTPPRQSATTSKVPAFRPQRQLSPAQTMSPRLSNIILDNSETTSIKRPLLSQTSTTQKRTSDRTKRMSLPPTLSEGEPIPNRFSTSTSTTGYSSNRGDSPITPTENYMDAALEPVTHPKTPAAPNLSRNTAGKTSKHVRASSISASRQDIPPFAPAPPSVNTNGPPPSAFSTNPVNSNYNYNYRMPQPPSSQLTTHLPPPITFPPAPLPYPDGLQVATRLSPPRNLRPQFDTSAPRPSSADGRFSPSMSGVDVDSIVQRELAKFLQQNPDLVSPNPSLAASSPRKSGNVSEEPSSASTAHSNGGLINRSNGTVTVSSHPGRTQRSSRPQSQPQPQSQTRSHPDRETQIQYSQTQLKPYLQQDDINAWAALKLSEPERGQLGDKLRIRPQPEPSKRLSNGGDVRCIPRANVPGEFLKTDNGGWSYHD